MKPVRSPDLTGFFVSNNAAPRASDGQLQWAERFNALTGANPYVVAAQVSVSTTGRSAVAGYFEADEWQVGRDRLSSLGQDAFAPELSK